MWNLISHSKARTHTKTIWENLTEYTFGATKQVLIWQWKQLQKEFFRKGYSPLNIVGVMNLS